jgi:preprotein translocase subunit SecE
MNEIVLYIKESYNELVHKVTWPTWPMLLESAKLVLVATAVISLVIFILDGISKTILSDFLYQLGQ